MAGVHSPALCQVTHRGQRESARLFAVMLSLVEDEVTDSLEHIQKIAVLADLRWSTVSRL